MPVAEAFRLGLSRRKITSWKIACASTGKTDPMAVMKALCDKTDESDAINRFCDLCKTMTRQCAKSYLMEGFKPCMSRNLRMLEGPVLSLASDIAVVCWEDTACKMRRKFNDNFVNIASVASYETGKALDKALMSEAGAELKRVSAH